LDQFFDPTSWIFTKKDLERLKIMQKGREAVDRGHQEAAVLLAQILAKMNEEEQEALLKGLEGFINAVMAVEEEE